MRTPDAGSAMLVIDLSVPEVKYSIFKNIKSPQRQERTEAFVALHALADDGF